MNPSFQFGADGQRDLQVLWEDDERVFCRGSSEDEEGGRGTVLVVLPAAERWLPASLDRLAHEYQLRDELELHMGGAADRAFHQKGSNSPAARGSGR